MYNLDVYQGNNQVDVDVYSRERGIPTTPKDISSAILKTQITNDSIGYIYFFHGNIYA